MYDTSHLIRRHKEDMLRLEQELMKSARTRKASARRWDQCVHRIKRTLRPAGISLFSRVGSVLMTLSVMALVILAV